VIDIPSGRWREAYDPTTGLATLWSFLEHTRRSLLRATRQSGTLAVLSTELLELGDPRLAAEQRLDFLLEAAARFQGVTRAGDLVARAGSAGFLVLCEDLGSLDEAVTITERLLEELDRPFVVSGDIVFIETHVGVGLPLDADTADGLVRRSLDAMYAARADPRRRYDVIVGSPDPDQRRLT
jgi:GGDEF domain-containing protein